jgi:demethylmenaquinone methyltransferase/2-methoxy-6-polyprenyl-1,4-benzoquinol methylase
VKIVAKSNPEIILDIATETGDLAILMAQTDAKIIGLDISAGMLDVGIKMPTRTINRNGVRDSENMPFDDNYFDAITVAFGVRNLRLLKKD